MTTYTATLTAKQARAAAAALDIYINTREHGEDTEATLIEVMWKLIRIIDQENEKNGVVY